MEFDTTADLMMAKESKVEGTRPRPRRAASKRKPPRKAAEGTAETSPEASSDQVGAVTEAPALPVARAKRTRSTARKTRATAKATQLVSATMPVEAVAEKTTPEIVQGDSSSTAVAEPATKVGVSEKERLISPEGDSTQRRRSRRGRRRRRDASEEAEGRPEVAASPVQSEPGEVRAEVKPSESDLSGQQSITLESRPLAEPAKAPSRERRRRRGRRGRGGSAEARGPVDVSNSRVIEETAETPTVDFADFDDELPLEDEPYSGEGEVELEGSDIEPDEEVAIAPVIGSRQMMINVSAGTECRIAILHDQRLEEFFIERDSTQSHVGNIYKGRVTNVEPSIQAAFIDFGLEKNGFLHISDVQPQYFPNHTGEPEDVGRKIPRHHRPPIQRCFRRGQEVIVQITKEGVGTKGPTLTSYLSIPGRFLVMMPGMSRHGVSRKIEDEAHRREMRDLLAELELPTGMGFILRTAGLGRNKRDLQRDLNYLVRLWKTVVERIKKMPAPAELYRESDLVTRTIRDIYTTDFDRIVIDDATVAKKVSEFLQIAVPRCKTVVEHYADREPLFHRFGIEAELERINMRHVPLPSGGSLVIDSTEALVAIDVNSGRFRSPTDAEETALRINIEAAEEIARQLRLRDLGGLIVCDFIDMRHDRNKRRVEQALRDALKKHKERARILRMSAFGLIEMTRQRQGPSLHRNLYTDCSECRGTGHVKLPESVSLDAMRLIQFAAHNDQVQKIVLSLSSDVAFRLLNQKRGFISQVEGETGKSIVILGNAAFTSDQMEIACEDARGRPVTISATASVQNNGRLNSRV